MLFICFVIYFLVYWHFNTLTEKRENIIGLISCKEIWFFWHCFLLQEIRAALQSEHLHVLFCILFQSGTRKPIPT